MFKKKKTICFDIDNTICKTTGSKYKSSKPILKNIKFINNLYEQGHTIKIFTARYMGRTSDNPIKAEKKKWKVKFHRVYFVKPSSDLYVDDKNLNFKNNWVKDLKKFLK